MALRPKDSAAAHELMSPDASPNLRVWQMFEEAASFDGRLGTTRDLLGDFQAATDGEGVRWEGGEGERGGRGGERGVCVVVREGDSTRELLGES